MFSTRWALATEQEVQIIRRRAAVATVVVITGIALATNLVPDTTATNADPAAPPPPTPACSPAYHQGETVTQMRRVYLHRLQVTRAARHHIAKMIGCQAGGTEASKNMRVVRSRFKRMRPALMWKLRFLALPAYEQAWAKATGNCESGNDPTTDTGNGFIGAFQFAPGTAENAGFPGASKNHAVVTLTTWYEQAVRAVRWKQASSASQWPVCGH